MRHIKFEFAEPLVAIQRVRNEVFLGDDGALWVASGFIYRKIRNYLGLLGIPNVNGRTDGYRKIVLGDPTMSFMSTFDAEEIVVVRGRDRVRIEDEFGNEVTPSQLDCYEYEANNSGLDI